MDIVDFINETVLVSLEVKDNVIRSLDHCCRVRSEGLNLNKTAFKTVYIFAYRNLISCFA